MKPKTACVVCNGATLPEELLRAHVLRSDLVIAADGGLKRLTQIGITPDLLVGDMDSLGTLSHDDTNAVEVITYPCDKDISDSEIAVSTALQRGAETVVLLCADGKRMDHFFSNLSLLACYPGRLFLIDQTFTAVALGDKVGQCEIAAEPDAIISVFALGDEVHGLNIEGTKWELSETNLGVGSIGLSNKAVEKKVAISISSGVLLIFAECDIDKINIIRDVTE